LFGFLFFQKIIRVPYEITHGKDIYQSQDCK
jgi:hypothetical protein